MLDKLLHDFLIIWATIDPIGTMALFAALTARFSAEKRRKTAYKTIIYSSLILVGAILLGQLLLTAMGISLISFQVAGGIILFLFGLQMIFANDSSSDNTGEPQHEIAVFPLAIPATASPGAILAVILITDNNVYTMQEQLLTVVTLGMVLASTLVLMLCSGAIIRFIGLGGASLLTRIMGMILAALSVEFVMEALGIARWVQEAL